MTSAVFFVRKIDRIRFDIDAVDIESENTYVPYPQMPFFNFLIFILTVSTVY